MKMNAERSSLRRSCSAFIIHRSALPQSHRQAAGDDGGDRVARAPDLPTPIKPPADDDDALAHVALVVADGRDGLGALALVAPLLQVRRRVLVALHHVRED